MDAQVVNPDWRRQKAVRLTCEFCGFGPVTCIPGPWDGTTIFTAPEVSIA